MAESCEFTGCSIHQNQKVKALELLKRKDRKERKTYLIDSLRTEIKEKDRLIRDLAGQWHSTKHLLEQSEKRERMLNSRNNQLNEKIARLTQQISKIIPLKPVGSIEN